MSNELQKHRQQDMLVDLEFIQEHASSLWGNLQGWDGQPQLTALDAIKLGKIRGDLEQMNKKFEG